jgi:hypothetical protein
VCGSCGHKWPITDAPAAAAGASAASAAGPAGSRKRDRDDDEDLVLAIRNAKDPAEAMAKFKHAKKEKGTSDDPHEREGADEHFVREAAKSLAFVPLYRVRTPQMIHAERVKRTVSGARATKTVTLVDGQLNVAEERTYQKVNNLAEASDRWNTYMIAIANEHPALSTVMLRYWQGVMALSASGVSFEALMAYDVACRLGWSDHESRDSRFVSWGTVDSAAKMAAMTSPRRALAPIGAAAPAGEARPAAAAAAAAAGADLNTKVPRDPRRKTRAERTPRAGAPARLPAAHSGAGAAARAGGGYKPDKRATTRCRDQDLPDGCPQRRGCKYMHDPGNPTGAPRK